ncbi:glycosyltransferase [Tissierella creatinini]|nr:glycosyltransferase [Tissierella creatinini]TJX62220.1 glycosyltransferase [Soehngenia saccharolytica]
MEAPFIIYLKLWKRHHLEVRAMNNSKKNILFMIPTLECGGAEKALVSLVNNLDFNKYSITVQTIINTGLYISELDKRINYKSIIKMKNKLFSLVFSYLIHFVIPPKLIYGFFVEKDNDIEVVFLQGLAVKIISASTNKKAKKYTWVQSDMMDNYLQLKIFKTVQNNAECYRKFDKIFCCSSGTRDSFIKRFGIEDNVYIQQNVIDDEIIKKASEEACDYDYGNNFKMITVGRLVEQKGYDRLIKVCAELKSEGFVFKLLIIGEGYERERLWDLIEKNELEQYVNLHGFDANPYKFMKKSDLFVCSSRVEGLSSVVIEALILSLPVITTNCTGMSDLLGDSEYGLIVDNDEESLYEGLKRFLTNKELLKHYKNKSSERSQYFKKGLRIKEIEAIFDEKEI